MSLGTFKIKGAHPLKQFLLLSLYLHIGVGLFHALLPEERFERQQLPPIKVSYLPPEKKTVPQKAPTLVETPEPEKIETPQTSDLIARYDSRAHSNRKPRKHLAYKNNKTAIPRAKKSPPKTQKPVPVPPQKTKPVLDTRPPQKPFPKADRGFALPKARGEVTRNPSPRKIEGGTLALLEGFDPDKYSKFDTQSPTPADDDEPISLDTRESKYAAYFARIKRQIERVWVYPEEARRRGMVGQLVLKFQIAKDGKLMNVWLMDQSGHRLLDDNALRAIKDAAPYYPFPVTIDRESLSIVATFIYQPGLNHSQYFPNH